MLIGLFVKGKSLDTTINNCSLLVGKRRFQREDASLISVMVVGLPMVVCVLIWELGIMIFASTKAGWSFGWIGLRRDEAHFYFHVYVPELQCRIAIEVQSSGLRQRTMSECSWHSIVFFPSACYCGIESAWFSRSNSASHFLFVARVFFFFSSSRPPAIVSLDMIIIRYSFVLAARNKKPKRSVPFVHS